MSNTITNLNLTSDGTSSYVTNAISSSFSQISVSASWSPIPSGIPDAYTFPTFISKIYTFRSNGFGTNSTIENGEVKYTGDINGDGDVVNVASYTNSSSLYLTKTININSVTSFESNGAYFTPHYNGSGQYWASYKETGHIGLFTGIASITSGIYFKSGYSNLSMATTPFPLTWSAVVCDNGIETEIGTVYTSSISSVLRWNYINNTASFYINDVNVATITKSIVSGYSCNNLIDVSGVYTPDQNSSTGCNLIRYNYLVT